MVIVLRASTLARDVTMPRAGGLGRGVRSHACKRLRTKTRDIAIRIVVSPLFAGSVPPMTGTHSCTAATATVIYPGRAQCYGVDSAFAT